MKKGDNYKTAPDISKVKAPAGNQPTGASKNQPAEEREAIHIIAPLPPLCQYTERKFTMKSRRNTRRTAQTAALLLTGALLGALVTAALSDKERSSDRTATVYSTAGAESWEYSGKGMQYDESTHKLSYSDHTGAKHTVYTLGYIVEVTEGGSSR